MLEYNSLNLYGYQVGGDFDMYCDVGWPFEDVNEALDVRCNNL